MPFVAPDPEWFAGAVVGDGHCVAYVRAATGAPHTSQWVEGVPVWEADGLPAGTAIATFDATGRYANRTDGSSHAAVFLEEDGEGIWVCDQWLGHPVMERLIRSKGGTDPACDDADAYNVIEAEDG